MENFTSDNLILLEFLVDSVNLEYGVQQDIKCLSGVTCVSFKFLDNAPLSVSLEDFSPNKKNYDDSSEGCSTVKNGKSCLFAMTPQQAEDSLHFFDVFVVVYKKMKPGMMPEKICIGETVISIARVFTELAYAVNEKIDDCTVEKSLKDCFKLTNSSGETVGSISLYIKMSCFGTLIVSRFQMNFEDKSVEFKAKDGHYMFQYNEKCPEESSLTSTPPNTPPIPPPPPATCPNMQPSSPPNPQPPECSPCFTRSLQPCTCCNPPPQNGPPPPCCQPPPPPCPPPPAPASPPPPPPPPCCPYCRQSLAPPTN